MVQPKTTSGMLTIAASRGMLIAEKRRETRYPTNDPAEVQFLPSTGVGLPAKVIDISRSGLRLELETTLGRGTRIEILILPRKLVLFGEVRYCRRSGNVFHAGVLIEGVVPPESDRTKHIHDDDLALYALGKGLTAPEVLRIKDHLMQCDHCVKRLGESIEVLSPGRGVRLGPRGEV